MSRRFLEANRAKCYLFMGHMKSSPPKARHAPKETPTRPSMQAVRLAEEERIASTSVGDREEVSQARRRDEAESGVVAAAARYAFESEPVQSEVHVRQRAVRPPPLPDAARGRARAETSFEVSQVARRIEKQVPRMLVGMKDISKFPIDPRSAFLLGYVDGSLTVEEIVDLCAMPTAEALELVDRLARLGVIALA